MKSALSIPIFLFKTAPKLVATNFGPKGPAYSEVCATKIGWCKESLQLALTLSRTGVLPIDSSLNAWSIGQTEITRMGQSVFVIKHGGQHSPERRHKPAYRSGKVCSSERSCSRPAYEIFVPVTALSSSAYTMWVARNHAPRKLLIAPDQSISRLGSGNYYDPILGRLGHIKSWQDNPPRCRFWGEQIVSAGMGLRP